MTRGARIAARGAILAVALAAAVAVASNGLSTRLLASDPLRAARLSPGNAAFSLAAAARLAGDDSGTRDPRVRRLVAAALSRSTSDPDAIAFRALEAGADGDPGREARLFRLSDEISRRNLPTRLWLIQDAVRRGDVAGALADFDIALRTSTDAPAILFPILATATTDPTLSAPLAGLFDRPSDWRAAFFHFALTEGDAAAGLAHVVPAMRDRAWLAQNGVGEALVGRLVADGDFAAARRTYGLFHREARSGPLVRDGDFGDPGASFPFGWLFAQKGEIGAERSLIGGKPALTYQALPGGDGAVASQLLMLPPGRYRLALSAATAAADPQAPPYWTIACASDGGKQIALLDMPVAEHGRAAADFAVPPDCPAQWLVLTLRGSDQPGGQAGAVASVSVSRLDRIGNG